jgi:hypothetical protein
MFHELLTSDKALDQMLERAVRGRRNALKESAKV